MTEPEHFLAPDGATLHSNCDIHTCKVDLSATMLPRVATSLDELRPGQWVAQKRDREWHIGRLDVTPSTEWFAMHEQLLIVENAPPSAPVPVPRELIDRLAATFNQDETAEVIIAARALVEAVRDVEN